MLLIFDKLRDFLACVGKGTIFIRVSHGSVILTSFTHVSRYSDAILPLIVSINVQEMEFTDIIDKLHEIFEPDWLVYRGNVDLPLESYNKNAVHTIEFTNIEEIRNETDEAKVLISNDERKREIRERDELIKKIKLQEEIQAITKSHVPPNRPDVSIPTRPIVTPASEIQNMKNMKNLGIEKKKKRIKPMPPSTTAENDDG